MSEQKSVFDFGSTTIPEEQKFLSMGDYWLSVSKAEFVKPEGNNVEGKPKTPYLEVVFTGKSGQVTEKFFISPSEGIMARLQYLHHALTGKSCEKKFNTVDEVGAYYKLLLNDNRIKSKVFGVTVGGRLAANGKIYGCLPYLHFLVDKDLAEKSGFEEGSIEENSPRWKNLLKVDSNKSTNTNDIMVGSSKKTSAQAPDVLDDLPF